MAGSIEAIRLTRRKYARAALTGEGALRFGGRFNSPGQRAIYASESLSLAALEILVHAGQPRDLADYVGLRLTFDVEFMLDVGPLPVGWRDNSWPKTVQQIGDEWLSEERSAVLRVPSAVVPSEHNYVINPQHPDFERILREEMDPDLDNRIYRLGERESS